MWSKRFCYETIDHFIRGYECGEIDRESAARFALAAAVFGPPDVGAYLADRFYEADVRLTRGRGDQPPDRESWALGVDEHALESLGLRTIEQMAREIQRKPGGSRTRSGKVWSQTGIRSALVRAQSRAGVSGWTLHTLRHSFVTELFRRGVGAPAVQRPAGHHSLSVTQRYSHVVLDDLRRAVDALDRGNGVETKSTGS